MPARKSAKKAYTRKSKPKGPIVAIYSLPIYNAIKRGNTAEMKKLATQARKHISDVETALAQLDKKIGGS